MRGTITLRSIAALETPTTGEVVLWDTSVRGFGLRVRATGSKTYILRYRPKGGGRRAVLRTLTIGKHGSPYTPDSARAKARELRVLIANGTDPAADRTAQRAAATVSELADQFLSEHAEAKRKSRTADEYRRIINRIVRPKLGRLKVIDAAGPEIARLHHSLHSTPYQANRTLAVLRKMFNLAEKWGMRAGGTNPCRHIEKYPEMTRERMLSPEELARLGEVLRDAVTNGLPHPRDPKKRVRIAPAAIAAVKLLIFSGARLNEVLGLRWEWIDIDRGVARLPDSKTGAKTLHLPPPALAVLANIPKLKDNPHVIAGSVKGAALVNLEKPWRYIRSAADLEDVRLHDLRHAFASIAAAAGMGLPIIGKILGHAQAATTARYAHLSQNPVKAAAAAIAGKIAAAMDPKPNGANVLPLTKRHQPQR